LKTNTILYGAISLVKFLGDNQIHAEAGIEETPEEGAIFEVYLKKAGSYEDAREFERDLLTTDAYGRAQPRHCLTAFMCCIRPTRFPASRSCTTSNSRSPAQKIWITRP